MKTHGLSWKNSRYLRQFFPDVQTSPVLVDTDGRLLAEGQMGESHRHLFCRALATAQDDPARIRLINALSNDGQHRFELTLPDGKPLLDETGRHIIMNRIEAGRLADASGLRPKQFRGMPLQSQQVAN
jgi:hypothetical protein